MSCSSFWLVYINEAAYGCAQNRRVLAISFAYSAFGPNDADYAEPNVDSMRSVKDDDWSSIVTPAPRRVLLPDSPVSPGDSPMMFNSTHVVPCG